MLADRPQLGGIRYCALKKCFIPYRSLQPILALGETRFDALTSTKDLREATKGVIDDIDVVMLLGSSPRSPLCLVICSP
jgi:hypothetical protein